ncbi:D-glycerate dehydrogenase [Apibacter muscae]|uniref:2-hydroxyacid dehydrogenase n=1 Tax=Apibacter muscae TaxID=2509004 RepID=UPI0011AB9426|nr:D-glycerate dehydrogenase [Apibacter muscae]TWP31268.1 D-glycerate dehydrogenase [Apibacter muscae]
MKKVFISGIIPRVGIDMLNEEGYTVEEWSNSKPITEKELISKCQKAEAYLCIMSQVSENFLKQCSHLKVIATYSVGFNHIDIATATKLKIPIGNTPDVLSNATADLAFLLMINVSRKAFFNYRRILEGKWESSFSATRYLGQELEGKTLGIFGMGRIGLKMAEKCRNAYGMKILYHNRNKIINDEKELNASYVSFEELLLQSDVLSIHAPLNSENSGIFDKSAFNKMKPSAILINTARGSIVNEIDLITALENKQIWGAGLDVTDPEPIQLDNPLLQMENVAITPHIGSATAETRNAMAVLCAKNIIAGLKGEKLPGIVNPDVYK